MFLFSLCLETRRGRWYRVTGIYQQPTDVGPTPSPTDQAAEVSLLIGGNISRSRAGHTAISFGPCFSSGSYQEENISSASSPRGMRYLTGRWGGCFRSRIRPS